jgi:glycosyltransferase involved in cell wall biosynthesis
MRAGLFLEALAREFEVTLLVVPVADGRPGAAIPDYVARRTARTLVLPLDGRTDPHFQLVARVRDPVARLAALRAYPRPVLGRFGTGETIRAADALVGETAFDAVHVMRIYLAPFVGRHLARRTATGRPACGLDLDDDESRTRHRLAGLYAVRGDSLGAALETSEAEKYDALEREWLPRFDVVFLCAESDRAALGRRLPLATTRIAPNAVALPEAAAGPRAGGGPALRLLFVGSLGYFPNEDAALFLCDEILPRLRALTARPVAVHIAGSGPPSAVARLGERAGVTVTAGPPSVAPLYAAADVAVVPVRAGGGTRIKVLEALAHGVPVVATPLGVEGLDVEPESDVLVADDAPALARACCRLGEDAALRQRLIARGRAVVASRYTIARVAPTIATCYRALVS